MPLGMIGMLGTELEKVSKLLLGVKCPQSNKDKIPKIKLLSPILSTKLRFLNSMLNIYFSMNQNHPVHPKS
jgi:hypothetical protein